ncbi:non-canonical purine NTP pyrophosphatase [Candidatus Saccharibacteria bacterium]|nr:non-canonical purine NTP pyrophosphatase [Candidatus Saccharibacteria bacterium]
MAKVTFITGNPHKARVLEEYLGYSVEHKKVELDEIQSLELKEIIEHKVKQAYQILKTPVLVEDVGLVIEPMDKLPGPFIKWFIETLELNGICDLVNHYDNRSAKAQVAFGYFDGNLIKIFQGEVKGKIAESPRGNDSFGWNPIFIPNGASKTYAEMDGDETLRFSLRTTTVFPQIKEFLSGLDTK